MCRSMYISCILILISINYGAADFMTKNSDNYGPYVVEWEHFDQCHGPKMTNLTSYTTGMEKVGDVYRGKLNLTFIDQTRIDEIKISVHTLKDNTKTLLWNYIVNKPCQHYMLAALLDTQLAVKNCVAKKGNYNMDLNMTALMLNQIGKSFFYGEYLFKVVVTSKKGNIVCLIFDPKFKKPIKKQD